MKVSKSVPFVLFETLTNWGGGGKGLSFSYLDGIGEIYKFFRSVPDSKLNLVRSFAVLSTIT